MYAAYRMFALYEIPCGRTSKKLIAVFNDRATANQYATENNVPSWHIEETVLIELDNE